MMSIMMTMIGRAKMTLIKHIIINDYDEQWAYWWLWSGHDVDDCDKAYKYESSEWVIIDDYDEHNDDYDRAKMTNGYGVWRLPECHTLMRWLLFIPLFLHFYVSSLKNSSVKFFLFCQTKWNGGGGPFLAPLWDVYLSSLVAYIMSKMLSEEISKHSKTEKENVCFFPLKENCF